MTLEKKEQDALQAGGTGNAPGAPPIQGDASNSGTPPAEGAVTFKSKEEFQQHLESVLKERLEREKRKQDSAAQKAREDAEAEALVKNQEWQKLAEQRDAKISELEKRMAELEPYQEKTGRYETALKAHLATQRQGLPAHVLTLLDKLDPVEQLEWIATNQEALKSQQPAGKQAPAGVPPTPPPNNGGGPLPPEEKRKRAFSIRNL